jgi:hypothetical protein
MIIVAGSNDSYSPRRHSAIIWRTRPFVGVAYGVYQY